MISVIVFSGYLVSSTEHFTATPETNHLLVYGRGLMKVSVLLFDSYFLCFFPLTRDFFLGLGLKYKVYNSCRVSIFFCLIHK